MLVKLLAAGLQKNLLSVISRILDTMRLVRHYELKTMPELDILDTIKSDTID